ncbi:hypothetical protein PoB_006908400 [Plakobranchus ocellatus]|uniref:Uncharacterized protein n=1 Tax=Plakobranchus ocellatus TaxID=259542 RepID=A0AAV4DEG0_9GAST|nr:hypothetical protein PoB_006908400 [Plakobranchus ocellatus]
MEPERRRRAREGRPCNLELKINPSQPDSGEDADTRVISSLKAAARAVSLTARQGAGRVDEGEGDTDQGMSATWGIRRLQSSRLPGPAWPACCLARGTTGAILNCWPVLHFDLCLFARSPPGPAPARTLEGKSSDSDQTLRDRGIKKVKLDSRSVDLELSVNCKTARSRYLDPDSWD